MGFFALGCYRQYELTQKLREELKTQKQTFKDIESEYCTKIANLEAEFHLYRIDTKQHLKDQVREINLMQANFETALGQATKQAAKEALAKSRSVMRGQATEHLAPFMTNEWSPKDYRFMSDPVDYVVFSGASSITDGIQDQIDEVILLDIKTGKSNLNKVQRRIRDAIIAGRVRFGVYNPDKNLLRLWPENQNAQENMGFLSGGETDTKSGKATRQLFRCCGKGHEVIQEYTPQEETSTAKA